MSKRLFIVVQNLMGTGHQRRAGAIARAALAARFEVTFVSGGLPMPHFDARGLDFVQLPPARCPDLAFNRLVDGDGLQVDDRWRAERRRALLAAASDACPDAVVIETFPFGRKLLRFELVPLLAMLRSARPRPLIVSSVRDIVEYRAKRARYEDMAALAKAYFDRVLVHADPALVPFEETFPPCAEIAPLLSYTGYVREALPALSAASTEARATDGEGEILVSAGGGAYGVHLLHAALEVARSAALAPLRWRILVGDNVGADDFRELLAAAPAGVVVERVRPDFRALLGRAALSISQGGYNTVLDVLQSGVRAVIVAYHDDSEREQLLRANILAARGFVTVLPDGQLDRDALTRAAREALARTPAVHRIDLRGAERSVELIAAALTAPS